MQLLRIFVNDEQTYHDRALYAAIVDAIREAGLAGATVFKGVEGFSRGGTLAAARAFETSTKLPVLIEVIDDDERIRAFVPVLRGMIDNGLITVEKIETMPVSQAAR